MNAASMTDLDRARLREALVLAQDAIGISDPNPRVGCLIGHADGRVLARGATRAAGAAHAEAAALESARGHGVDVRGATAWVTLEPCAHHGRTPPCSDALAAAGIARVVIGSADPFPQVDGRGIARLRAAGIEVLLADEAIAADCRELNIGFFHRIATGRPWVRMKVAASLDGRTALPDGRSQWITGVDARTDGHAWRKRAQAVLSGIGTVLEDDPRLDVRLVPTTLQPLRVVVDSRWQTPPGARVLGPPGEALVIGAADDGARRSALHERGAHTLIIAGGGGKTDLAQVVAELGRREVNELHVEAGPKLNASLLRAGLVDELLVYLAPRLLGDGRGMAELGILPSLDAAVAWRWHEVQPVGTDLRLRLRR